MSNADRTSRELRDQIKSEIGWLEQLSGELDKQLMPPELVVAKSSRDRMDAARAAKYDEHEARKKRLERRLVAAEAAVAAIRKRILAV